MDESEVRETSRRRFTPPRRAGASSWPNYWYPVYAYVRRRGYDVEDARDLMQAFSAKLLEKNGLTPADTTRGRSARRLPLLRLACGTALG